MSPPHYWVGSGEGQALPRPHPIMRRHSRRSPYHLIVVCLCIRCPSIFFWTLPSVLDLWENQRWGVSNVHIFDLFWLFFGGHFKHGESLQTWGSIGTRGGEFPPPTNRALPVGPLGPTSTLGPSAPSSPLGRPLRPDSPIAKEISSFSACQSYTTGVRGANSHPCPGRQKPSVRHCEDHIKTGPAKEHAGCQHFIRGNN